MKKAVIVCLSIFLLGSCAPARVALVTREEIPLKEYTISGKAEEKVLVISVKGTISDEPRPGLIFDKPSMVQEVVSQLRRAEEDKQVRALLLKIDSAGGTATASDLLYHEISEYKKKTGVKVVAVFMNVAASGAYYIGLAADHIMAHPTSITGSIGVVFFQPKVMGLMDKIGVGVDVSKSGEKKDMGSPFRPATAGEQRILQGLTDRLGKRFVQLVKEQRGISPAALEEVATARIFLADEALEIGLIDRVGYLNDAIGEAKQLAGLPPDARVVVYRRTEFPDDNLYNPMVTSRGSAKPTLIEFGFPKTASQLNPGFYYLWAPGMGAE
jgi:protease-4